MSRAASSSFLTVTQRPRACFALLGSGLSTTAQHNFLSLSLSTHKCKGSATEKKVACHHRHHRHRKHRQFGQFQTAFFLSTRLRLRLSHSSFSFFFHAHVRAVAVVGTEHSTKTRWLENLPNKKGKLGGFLLWFRVFFFFLVTLSLSLSDLGSSVGVLCVALDAHKVGRPLRLRSPQ